MRKKVYFLCVLFLFLVGCKEKTNNQNNFSSKDNILVDTVSSTKYFSENEIDTILKEEEEGQEWVEINKIGGSFKRINAEWKRFVKIKGNDKAEIELMEPVNYELDSIKKSTEEIILYIKNADWIYKFYWVDKKSHIGRWEYIYNQTEIDPDFSMYVIDKKYEHILN